ncbi:hypothetical protein FKW77_001979 [Venturia effusa]|uniref:PEBP-like protein n=1 Tax=Venturia effusa TaxID=50376 RepID=A0A517LMC4_9PEZI|nr:hypothetical protein FKW77_001979 [Venturia effusa]
MKTSSIATILAVAASAAAQTPDGFTPAVNTNLGITYGNITVSPPGEQLERSAVANPPNITASPTLFSNTSTAVLIMIDLDVVRNGTRIPNLHWIAPSITAGTSNNASQLNLAAANAANGVEYRQPSPPVGDYAHRYIFLLYSQPPTFPSSLGNLTNNRIGFNLTNFVAMYGLTTPVAANYILVQNSSAPATTAYPSPSYAVSTTVSVATATPTGSGAGASSTAAGRAGGVEKGSGFAFLIAVAGLFVRL